MPPKRRRVAEPPDYDRPKTTRRQGGPSAPVQRPLVAPKVAQWIMDSSLAAREGLVQQTSPVWGRDGPVHREYEQGTAPVGSPDSIAHGDAATRFTMALGRLNQTLGRPSGGIDRWDKGPGGGPYVPEERRKDIAQRGTSLSQWLGLRGTGPQRMGNGRGFRGY